MPSVDNMNERIREIITECETEYSTSYEPSYDMDKFAELIVRECCSAIRLDDAFNGGKFQRTILTHFGVEE
jgi:hypothetical protein